MGFIENPRQNALLREIAIDFNMGEHMLLIGNQGFNVLSPLQIDTKFFYLKKRRG
jgi:hypothetical protein